MKNRIFLIINTVIFILFSSFLFAENLTIESKIVNFDKKKQKTIFKNNVVLKTQRNETIKSQYAEYDKLKGLIILKEKVRFIDKQENIVETDYAEYFEDKEIFQSKGQSKIITYNGYNVNGKNFILDNKKKILTSENETVIEDPDKNILFLNNFEFLNKKNIFKSIGLIKVTDKYENTYEFSQIYIDTNKKEILGTDIKAFVNEKKFKINPENEPRIFCKLSKN